jgi:hypothetical protein
MKRRTFLSLITAGAAAAGLPAGAARPAPVLSAWAESETGQRRYFAGRIDGPPIALPARGHALLAHPRRADVAYVCARRPGAYLLRFNPATGRLLDRVDVDDDRRFEGHAVIDVARNRLLTTESELEHGAGRIGIYNADTLAPLGEWSTHGIGPHELLCFGRDVIAVANGGILTLPETGRVKRNLDTMEPSLVLLDARDGRRLAAFTLPDRKLSIRHLAVAEDGVLGVALQNEGQGTAPLLALLRDGRLVAAQTDAPTAELIGGYAASVAACGERFAVTCTRGDRIAVWDTGGRYRGAVAMRKPAGIVTVGSEWLVSNEFGELWRIDAERLRVNARHAWPRYRWDNHLTLVDNANENHYRWSRDGQVDPNNRLILPA